MRPSIVLAVFLLAGATAAEAGNKECLTCHTAPQFSGGQTLPGSVHAKLECAECHRGYDFSTHRAKEPELSADEQKLLGKLEGKTTAPAALVACGRCHDSQRDDLSNSVHGRWLKEDRPVAGANCLSCHGDPHAIIAAKNQNKAERRRMFTERCLKCHGNLETVKKAGLNEHVEAGYRDSVHGRMNALGNERAPTCANCHSTHDIADIKDEASLVNPKNKAATCGECHKGANQHFADVFTHAPLTRARAVPFWTMFFFSLLTAGTLAFLVLHVVLDFGSELRHILRKRKGVLDGHQLPADAPKTVVRFDIHQRIQHWLLITSILTLVFTDWPLRAGGTDTTRYLTSLVGGIRSAQIIHRCAGMVMGLASLYHLVYLTVMASKRQKIFTMVPGPKDLRDIMDNFRYFFGVRNERPAFGKYAYHEKFDYWAVFWGVIIMFSTGLVRWFPVFFAKVLPGGVIEAMQIAHGDEATLAALALFVWHLYNVHLKPSVFPMNWTWLDGKIETHALRDEHRAQYDEMFGGKERKP